MSDTLDRIDSLLNELSRNAMNSNNPAAVVSQLLHASRSLIKVAEEVSSSNFFIHDVADLVENHRIRRTTGNKSKTICQRSAEKMYKERLARLAIFRDDDIFGEPAWDILLDLFASERVNKRISITSACLASNTPSTTALRWLTVLQRKNLIERIEDDQDARRCYVVLTTKGRNLLIDYFEKIEEISFK